MKNHLSGSVETNGINIYYEIHGEGEPLLLIEGLGYSSWMWFKQIPALSREFRVIIFDNRGVGNTDKPNTDYTIEIMADDAAGLLKALQIESAHILGVSMGGFIAEELAIKHPDMIKSLVLVSTSFGGKDGTQRSSNPFWNMFVELWGIMPGMVELSGGKPVPTDSLGLVPEQKIRYGLSLAFTPEYFKNHSNEVDQIVLWRLANPQPLYAWKRQFMAGVKFDAADRVHLINIPTVVVIGSEDRIIPPESSKRLAEEIADSRLVVLEGTGHLLFIEREEEFNKMVLGFLHQVSKDGEINKIRKWWNKILSFFVGNQSDSNRNYSSPSQ